MRVIPWILGASLLSACHTPHAGTTPDREAAACVLDAPAEVIPVEGPKPGELNEFFELTDSPEWWAPAPLDAERQQYRAALVARLGEEGLQQRPLLQRQNAVHTAMVGKPMRREAENSGLVLEGKAGKQGPATCLEWRLFQRQAHRYPMLEHPTELGAYILRGHGRIRVYFSGGDSVGGRLRHEVSDRVAADAAQGFEPIAHLHNHPFMFDRKPGDRLYTTEDSKDDIGGALAPSLTDVQAWRSMREYFGLTGAWLTNGLDSIHYTSADFDRLSAWEPTGGTGVAPCTSPQLAIEQSGSDAGAGHQALHFTLRNTSNSTCTLQGHAGVRLVGSSGQPLPGVTVEPLAGGEKPAPLTLSPGGSAAFELVFATPTGGLPCQGVAALEVTPPSGGLPTRLARDFQVCGPHVSVTPPRAPLPGQP